MKQSVENELRRKLKLDTKEELKTADRGELRKAIYDYAQERIMSFLPGESCDQKQVIYASMEILPGRTLSNNLMNLPEGKALMEIMSECGIDINEIENMENEPSLGNGGLGRLGGGMAESAAAKDIAFTVSTLRYRKGLFRQKLKNGRQVEEDDVWLDEDDSYPFEERCENESQVVCFRLQDSWVQAEGVPCDIPVVGAAEKGRQPRVNRIRAWAVNSVSAEDDVDCTLCERIDESLYPDDTTHEGRMLRLMQEYFLSAVTIGDMLRCMRQNGWSLESMPEHFVLHINDTHPALMIPELMRVLCREYCMDAGSAFDICRRVFVYTNHTILAEALEKWDISMVEELLPHVYREIHLLHCRFEEEICARYPGDWAKMRSMDILWDGKVRMAHLAIYGSSSVNGVAKIHTDILCRRELTDFHQFFPGRFCNVTNGATQRKWLVHANPCLSKYIDRWTGGTGWHTDLAQIEEVRIYAGFADAQKQFAAIRKQNKERLREFVRDSQQIDLPTNFMYDVHVKRLHEYKRQLLNCMKIIALYNELLENPSADIHPTAFIFAGKAAKKYEKAKLVIELIEALGDMINNDSKVNSKLRVAFIENYNVTAAEIIFAAADCSEQISTASKEASGTGCMKSVMNGSPIIGTLDGANVEICEAVGEENMYLFGLRSDEVMRLEANPGLYNPQSELQASAALKKVIDMLCDGTIRRLSAAEGEDASFKDLVNELLCGENGNPPDRYFLIKDFPSYMEAFRRMNRDYGNPRAWNRRCLLYVASSAYFSSDRMVSDYVEKVWKL